MRRVEHPVGLILKASDLCPGPRPAILTSCVKENPQNLSGLQLPHLINENDDTGLGSQVAYMHMLAPLHVSYPRERDLTFVIHKMGQKWYLEDWKFLSRTSNYPPTRSGWLAQWIRALTVSILLALWAHVKGAFWPLPQYLSSSCLQQESRRGLTALRPSGGHGLSRMLVESGMSPTRNRVKWNSKQIQECDCYWNRQHKENNRIPLSSAWKFCHIFNVLIGKRIWVKWRKL